MSRAVRNKNDEQRGNVSNRKSYTVCQIGKKLGNTESINVKKSQKCRFFQEIFGQNRNLMILFFGNYRKHQR